jgi:ribose transport system permease protein
MTQTATQDDRRSNAPPPAQGNDAPWSRMALWFSPRRISAVYVFLVLFGIFAVWIPDLFLTTTTWRTLLNNQAVTALAALALVTPLAAGVFNLAVGAQVGAASIFIGWLLVEAGVPMIPAIALCLLSGCVIGLGTAFLVIRTHIDSFIATLGVSSLLAAFITAISAGQQILGVPEEYAALGRGQLFGVTYPVYAVVIVALVLWYVLERTPAGRRIYGTGGNIEAARLAGVRTSAVIMGSLVVCGVVASIAGMFVTASLANADPTIGPGYLLPAFTAAFLGSTQFRGGRFNVWGTVLAVYVLATGVKGLQLAGAPVWIPDAFNGAALLLAVGLAKMQGNPGRTSAIARLLRRRGGNPVKVGS